MPRRKQAPKSKRFSEEADLSIQYRDLIWTDEQLAAAAPGSITAIYARRSPRPRKTEDNVFSLVNQITNGLELTVKESWTNVVLFIDQSVSASNPNKPRPEYDRMIKWMSAGRLARAVCRDVERLYRLPRELEDLIDLLDSRDFPIHLTHDAKMDLSTPGGRLHARIRVDINRSNVEEMSKKRNLTEKERVAQGLISTGIAPFGYEKNKDKTLYVKVPEQAKAIQEAYTYLLRLNGTLAEVARRWNKAGFRNTSGAEWTWSAVKHAVLNPAVCGFRAYQRTTYLYENAPDRVEPWDAELTKGKWPPIVSHKRWLALKLVLTKTKQQQGNNKRYVGSGLYSCPEYEMCPPLKSTWGGTGAGRARFYTCRDGAHHTHIKASTIDTYVTGLLMGYLQDPVQFAALMSRSDTQAVADAEAEARRRTAKRADLERSSAELGEAFADGLITLKALTAGEARIKRELEELGATDLPVVEESREEIPWDTVAQRWDELEIEVKKHVLATVFPLIVVYPTGKTSKKPPIEDYIHVYDYRGRLLPLVEDDTTFVTRAAQRYTAERHGKELLEPEPTPGPNFVLTA
jgi:DNA invertase Pin-like site-specific DNA recombinase